MTEAWAETGDRPARWVAGDERWLEWAAAVTARSAPALRVAFQELLARAGHGEVVAVGVWSDGDAGSVSAAVCTADDLAGLAQAAAERGYDSPQDAESFRWSTNEWALEAYGPESPAGAPGLAEVSAELYRVGDLVADADEDRPDEDRALDVFRRVTWAALVDALAVLVEEDLLGDHPHAVRVFEVTDGSLDDGTWLDFMEVVNTPVGLTLFREWLASFDPD